MTTAEHNQRYSKYLDGRCKRIFDVLVCAAGILPAMVLMIPVAAGIAIFDGRPILFIQRRVGKNGRIFRMPKFRTLKADGETADRAATFTGKFLRRYRLDELPQIFSVIAGEMSIVGPRPELVDITAGYKRIHKKRLIAKPGITGLWQVLGDRSVPIHGQIKYDLYYLRKAGLRLDIQIIFMTIAFIFGKKANSNENRVHTYDVSMPK